MPKLLGMTPKGLGHDAEEPRETPKGFCMTPKGLRMTPKCVGEAPKR